MLSQTVRRVVGTVAPGLATALGGPLAGAATKRIATELGLPDTSAASLEERLAAPDPDDLAKLKAADNDFAQRMRKLGVDLERIAADDRADARDMRVESRDRFGDALGAAYTLGFFAVFFFMLRYGVPDGPAGQALLLLAGALVGRTDQIVSFYFGSSKGSKDKTAMISEIRGHGTAGRPRAG